MKKRIIALLCALVMIVSLVACSNDTPATENPPEEAPEKVENGQEVQRKEPVTIAYWYWNNVGEQEYTDEVEAKLNELLAATPGYEHITIDLRPCKDYATDLTLAIEAGEQIDLISLPGAGDEAYHIDNGLFVPLDDYIAANPEITAELPDWFIEMGKYDGVTYYVPNYQQMANQLFYYTREDWFEESGWDYDELQQAIWDNDVDKMAQFEEDITLAARKVSGNDNIYSKGQIVWYSMTYLPPSLNNYTTFGDSFFYYDEDTHEFSYIDLHEGVKKGYEYVAKWYDEGILYEDMMSESDAFNHGFTGEYAYAARMSQSFGTPEMVDAQRCGNEAIYAEDGDIVVWAMDEYVTIGHTNAAQGVGVSSTSENPEDAANVLALLFNSKYEEFYNTLCYGLEGIHYKKTGDGTINTLEFSGTQGDVETTYCYWKWVGGNTFNAWLNQSMTQEQEDYILNELNEGASTKITELAGFRPDTSPYENQIAQCKTVYSEYKKALYTGVKGAAGWEAFYNEYIQKLEASGLYDVIDGLTAQAQEFLATK